jgi:hypothetical protein
MHDGARLLGPNGAEQLTSLGRGQLDEFHPPSRGQVAHLLHDREAAVGTGTDHELGSRPGDRLIGGQRRVSEPVPVRLGGVLLSATSFPPATITSWAKRIPPIMISPNREYSPSTPPTLRRRPAYRFRRLAWTQAPTSNACAAASRDPPNRKPGSVHPSGMTGTSQAEAVVRCTAAADEGSFDV